MCTRKVFILSHLEGTYCKKKKEKTTTKKPLPKWEEG